MRKNNRPYGVVKTENGYQKMISKGLYEKTPKAVFAAIAVSLLLNFKGTNEDDIDADLLEEWKTLNANGIVPQKPAK